jgi:hypothetical protein|nr:MAG TPA: Protein of unknown function (DUF551) [Caudoviricetes sp.]
MKQTLEEAAIKAAEDCHEMPYNENLLHMLLIKQAFELGAEWQRGQSPWVSVKDELPPIGVDVIHTDINTGKCHYGQVNKVGTLILGWTPYGEVTATHYMLVPPFPFDEIIEANKDVLERIKEKGD